VNIFRFKKPDVDVPNWPDGKPLSVNVAAVCPPGAGDCVGVALAVGNGVGECVAVGVGVGEIVKVGVGVGVGVATVDDGTGVTDVDVGIGVGVAVCVGDGVGVGVVAVDDGTGVTDGFDDGDADTEGPADGVALLVEVDVGAPVGEIPGDGVGAVPPLYSA
jgi:hypothetical protein